jgi:hypothetical protein
MTENELRFMDACLLDGEINVKFIKADGSERLMRCTQDADLIPAENLDTDGKAYQAAADCYRVFDLDIMEWRAFKPSRVIEWSTVV